MQRDSSPTEALDYPSEKALPDTSWVFWANNGIRWPDGRRQSLYISTRTHHNGRQLFSMFVEEALIFPERKHAVRWLREQPHDYSRIFLVNGSTLRSHWHPTPFPFPLEPSLYD